MDHDVTTALTRCGARSANDGTQNMDLGLGRLEAVSVFAIRFDQAAIIATLRRRLSPHRGRLHSELSVKNAAFRLERVQAQ